VTDELSRVLAHKGSLHLLLLLEFWAEDLLWDLEDLTAWTVLPEEAVVLAEETMTKDLTAITIFNSGDNIIFL
jgi:hypothetical protein